MAETVKCLGWKDYNFAMTAETNNYRAPANRTLQCDETEINALSRHLLCLRQKAHLADIKNRIICQDILTAAEFLPLAFADLMVLDPPYNLTKHYHGHTFTAKEKRDYAIWFEDMLRLVRPFLKPQATVYICADWKTSVIIAPLLESYFYVRNRITWEREKGRGAKMNWKNNTEDIWFCTMAKEYFFDVEAVKIKRRVVAPYKDPKGQPKDWQRELNGNYRLTYPSNIWTDISVPFWSMPENTDHPAQKPEKLLAKLILSNTRPNDVVFDPFMGSGTTAVVAQKLGRNFVCVEQNKIYCCWAQKRLGQSDNRIQGYADGVFWERNSLPEQTKKVKQAKKILL